MNSAKRLAVSILAASTCKYRGDNISASILVESIVESYTHYFDTIQKTLTKEELIKMTHDASRIVSVCSNRIFKVSYNPELSWNINSKNYFRDILLSELDLDENDRLNLFN